MANSELNRTKAAASPLMDGERNFLFGASIEIRRGVRARMAANKMRMAVRATGRLTVAV